MALLTIVIDHGKFMPKRVLLWALDCVFAGSQSSNRRDVMETVPVSKFKATCLKLLTDVKKTGRSILITRKGEPIALVTPPPPPPRKKEWVGCLKGSAKIVGDIISPAINEKEWEVLER